MIICCIWLSVSEVCININIKDLSCLLKRFDSCPLHILTPNWQVIARVEGELTPVTDFRFVHQAFHACGHVLTVIARKIVRCINWLASEKVVNNYADTDKTTRTLKENFENFSQI